MGLPRVGVTRCTHRHHRHLFCAFLSALIIKVADRHEAAIKRYWNAGKKRAEVKCNRGFFNRTTLSLSNRVDLGGNGSGNPLIFVWIVLTNLMENKTRPKMLKHPVSTILYSLPYTHMGVYQQVINVSPPHHSHCWMECVSFFSWWTVFFSPALYSVPLPPFSF